ncbi:hypothetical protein [Polaromonas sp.]|uniref:hypothetical protein n=1 Tax=Polaromonas sp. TaxID=1869339 RepID=UPI0017CD3D0C|nr:hypothetical protein [Polaromonas sp.]NMM08538.1 hypothetical protein [Polaromonas sp.]
MDSSKPTKDADQPQQHGDAKKSQPTRQIGEGSYEGSREYGESMKAYLETADVKADGEAAQPTSPEEAEQLKKAEQEGLAHSKAPGK